MPLNLNHLRIFHTVAEQGSITAAAGALKISQPAVSKQLAEFEAHLRTTLVDRLPRGVRLTAAGELLREHSQRIFHEEQTAERAMAELLGLAAGRLSVGASTTVGGYLVPGVLGDYCKRHPAVALDLQIGNTHAIQSAVLEGRVDVGLTEGFADSQALDARVFTHDEMVLITAGNTSPGNHLPVGTPVRAADLSRLPFIVREPGSGTRDVIEAALAERNVTLDPVMSLGSTEAIKNSVAQGLGVAIVSKLAIAAELEVGRLREVHLTDLAIRRALHCLTLAGKSPSPAATEFLRLLTQTYDESGDNDFARPTPT
jgi:DNA-binding transcriptional LysR family regulator